MSTIMLTISKLSKRLSKQQKLILRLLYEWPSHSLGVSTLSWYVAERLNERHNDRIWDSTSAIEELRRENPEVAFLMAPIIRRAHRKRRVLTNKHSASFSRALRRLEKRCLVRLERGSRRCHQITLTALGLEVCKLLFDGNG